MNKFILFLISLFAVVVFFSCKKSTLVGSDILPKGDNLNGILTDSLTLYTKTVHEDSLRISGSATYLLGSMQEPVFGKTSAGIFTQFTLSTFNPSFRNCTIDSVVLSLVYKGSYGNVANAMQSVTVYPITATLNSDSSYYSNRSFAYDPVQVGQRMNFTPDFTHSIHEYGDSLKPMLRVKLNNTFGQNILDADSANFITLAAFQNFFKGFYLQPNENAPGTGMIYLNLTDADTRLTLFYHNATSDSLRFNFGIGSGCASTNLFKHNYSNSLVNTALKNHNKSDSILYVQSMAGVKSRITIPFLKSLGHILVNKAEIEVTQVFDPMTDDSTFHVPSQMILLKADSLGKDALIPDLLTTAYLKYGGIKSTFINSQGQTVVKFTFSIADQLQLIVNNKITDYGFYLINYNSTETADRFVLGGNKRNDAAKMKLKLIYTKLP